MHGGEDKTVYAIERYEVPGSVKALPWGMFGENFTTEGLIEDAVNIGDSFHVGSAEV